MDYDDVVIGAGHNGLTAAAYLARAGRRVLVIEAADHVGGAAVSAQAFEGVDARLSRYSYLVSLLPQQVMADLDLDVRLIRRRYSSFTPVPGDPRRSVLVDTGDHASTAQAFAALTGSDGEYREWERFYGRMTSLAQRLFPTVLEPLRASGDVASLVGDDGLWHALTERPLGELIEQTFADDTVRGIVATDALIGTFADMHGSDLRQNVCFLYHLIGGGTGDWDVPVGGMGTVTDALARAATAAGADIRTDTAALSVSADGEVVWDGGSARASRVLAACAPVVLNGLLEAAGADPVPTEAAPEGAQLKVNMLLSRLPRLKDPAADPAAAFAGTFNIIHNDPDETPPEEFRFDLCAATDRPIAPNDAGVVEFLIPAGRCGSRTQPPTPLRPSPGRSTSTRATSSCRTRMPRPRPGTCRGSRPARSTATASPTAASSAATWPRRRPRP